MTDSLFSRRNLGKSYATNGPNNVHSDTAKDLHG
jgi:hypothetical protein